MQMLKIGCENANANENVDSGGGNDVREDVLSITIARCGDVLIERVGKSTC